MALENNTFAHGGVVFPIPTGSAKTLLERCDPAVFTALDFYQKMIEVYAGAALLEAATAAGLSRVTVPVAYTLPDDPGAYLTEEQVKFPLLCVYRVSGTNNQRTLTWDGDAAQWRASYVLPPMTAGQRESVYPILHAIAKLIQNRTNEGSDPNWNAGARVWGLSYAKLDEIWVTGEDYGAWDAGGELTFPSITLTLLVKEREMPVTGAYDPMGGVDMQTDVTDGSGTTTHVVDSATYF